MELVEQQYLLSVHLYPVQLIESHAETVRRQQFHRLCLCQFARSRALIGEAELVVAGLPVSSEVVGNSESSQNVVVQV